jgi:glucose-6-phosphate-specific signal transduction histidine kinase
MRIRVPDFLVSAWAPIEDWINVPIYKDFRRIDVILLLAGIFAVSYYWYFGGWQQAIVGGLMYILMLMAALWFFR